MTIEKSISQHGARLSFRINQQISDFAALIRENASDEDYERYKILIAEAIYKVNVALLDTAINNYPEIQNDIEESINRYGRYL